MRGKAAESEENIPINRITPAYAGKSQTTSLTRSTSRDHPRLCGEKQPPNRRTIRPPGSPPPMRGKVMASQRYTTTRRDHPRLCGEKGDIMDFGKNLRGSPPPMRGKASPHSCRKSYAGITPAYAGKRKKQKGS